MGDLQSRDAVADHATKQMLSILLSANSEKNTHTNYRKSTGYFVPCAVCHTVHQHVSRNNNKAVYEGDLTTQ